MADLKKKLLQKKLGLKKSSGVTPTKSGTESLEERIARMRSKLEAKQGVYFKGKEGVNRVRILPSWRGPGEDWYLVLPSHQKIGPQKKGFATCLDFWGESCTICNAIERLQDTGSNRDLTAAAEMKAVDKYLMQVGYPNTADGVVKPWMISENWFLEIIACYGDEEYGDFTDSKIGHDYIFTRRGTTFSDTKYTNKHFDSKETPILIPGGRKILIDLDAFVKHYTPKELKAMLAGDED